MMRSRVSTPTSSRRTAQGREGEDSRLRVPIATRLKGKRAGKTKAEFFREEQKPLKPLQPGLFDDLPEN